MKPKNRIYCPAIRRSKMLFETEEKAERFIKFNESEIKKTGNIKFKHLRAYYCQVCGGWHITHASLSKKEQERRDKEVDNIISKATEDIERKKKLQDERLQDTYEFIMGFDLASFGGKKKFKKYLQSNSHLIPHNIEQPKLFHIIKQIPPEYFSGERNFQKEHEEISQEEATKKAIELYQELPLQKLTTKNMISEYIKWEFIYKRSVSITVIKELNKLCGL